VGYWHKAGQRANKRSAHVEAVAHLRQGLALLQTLPETPARRQQELLLHIALGASLIATKGASAPEVAQTYTDARQLCAHLDDPQLFPVLRGLWNYYLVRAELQTAHALGEQLLALAQQTQDPVQLSAARRAVGTTLFYLGAAAEASTPLHVTQAGALDEIGAWALWYLGYPDQGLARNDETVTLAQQSAHPFRVSFALSLAAGFHQLRREVRDTQEHAEAAIHLATEQGFPHWIAHGAILCGWALTQQGQAQEGIEQIHLGLTTYRATGAELSRPYFLALLAEAYGTMGQPEAGLAVLTEALALVDTTGARWCEPELYRLKGELLLLQQSSNNSTEAATCFQHAISIAQHQQAKSWELRAATSLARLWCQQGKRQDAHDLLAPVYGWFTEGFDTADLKDAKALLDELA
jgi:predicted ATPase